MNRLAQETSPYLLQHAENPVDWYAWGDEAFDRARAEDKPILLSIGYAACHWCHVMERESFEDDATAELMNELFVSVKVDREERPDVDAVYMEAVQALTGQGGWPMTVFLTPDGEPFFGGTYYPPEPRHGLPSFQQLLQAIGEAYRDRRADVAEQARALVESLQRSGRTTPSGEPLTDGLFGEAERVLRAQYDPQWGGFGRAPKFPPASTIEFLLRRGVFDLALGTLDGMRAGGMYDLVGGGFHRYSVDAEWLVPHFEKMLYDNALLVPAYLHAWVLTGESSYRTIVEETIEYTLRELRLDGGGFASAQDADTDGVEGLTFTWTAEELAAAIGPGRDDLLQPFEHGRSIVRGGLSRGGADDALRASRAADEAVARRQGDRGLERLDARRTRRVGTAARPGGLARRRARAGRVPARPAVRRRAACTGRGGPASRREPGISRTTRTSRTASTSCTSPRASCAGCTRRIGSPGSPSTSSATTELGGFFLTPSDGEVLVARQKDLDDNPTPSGNSMLAFVLLRLARIWGDDELERRAVGVLRLIRDVIPRAPSAFGWALCALDLHLSPRRELAIVGGPESEIARAALHGLDANAVVAFGPADDVPLLAGKTLVDGRPAVYVCERFACRAPVTEPDLL